MVTTKLRSTPCGRVGLLLGNSPAAIRSVQSAKLRNARWVSISPMSRTMVSAAGPTWTRWLQASNEFSNLPSAGEIVRVGLLPSWWQELQAWVLSVDSHWPWLLRLTGMPLPFGPVPGNRLLSGISSIEYQYCAG